MTKQCENVPESNGQGKPKAAQRSFYAKHKKQGQMYKSPAMLLAGAWKWTGSPALLPLSASFPNPSQYLKHSDVPLLGSLREKVMCGARCQF